MLSQRNSDFHLSPLLYFMQPMDSGGGRPPNQEGLAQSKTEKGLILSQTLQLWVQAQSGLQPAMASGWWWPVTQFGLMRHEQRLAGRERLSGWCETRLWTGLTPWEAE